VNVPELRTRRLVLRPFSLAQARDVLTGVVPTGESWASAYPLADEVGLLRLVLDAGTEPAGWGPWQVLDRRDGRLRAIGGIGFLGRPDQLGEVEVGFGLVPASRGSGLAAEALRALVSWAGEHGAGVVYGITTADNLASQHTMHRAGLRQRADPTADGSVLRCYATPPLDRPVG
jgi:RimJ/RimL family protein N-acetyltransferase